MPFTVGRDASIAAFKGWLGRLWFRPSDLRDKASVSELRGVYVPYWTFDSRSTTYYTGALLTVLTTTVTVRDSTSSAPLAVRATTRIVWAPAGALIDSANRPSAETVNGLPFTVTAAPAGARPTTGTSPFV